MRAPSASPAQARMPPDLGGHECLDRHGTLQVQHLERFNLGGSAAGLVLVAGEEAAAAVGPRARPRRDAWEYTRSVYLQNAFVHTAFYQLPTLDARTWLYVLESKTVAGRDERDAEDAQARPLVVCFFEEAEGAPDELLVQRTDSATSGMAVQLLTVAELALHLGLHLAYDPERAAGEAERLVEKTLDASPGVPVVRYSFQHRAGAEDPHTYALTEVGDAYAASFNSSPLESHSKYALAKRLERRHGWAPWRLWNLKKERLEQAVRDGVYPGPEAGAALADVAPVDAVVAVAPGGRGRGRGRAAAAADAAADAVAVAPGGRGRGRGRAIAARGRGGRVAAPGRG